MRASGGAMVVESALGRGTTVRAYLPELRRDEVPETPGRPAPRDAHWPAVATPAPAGTVLVVDDDAGMLRASARMLRRLGLEAVTVASGEAALAAFAAGGARGAPLASPEPARRRSERLRRGAAPGRAARSAA
jgi:hypothetical protein